MTDNAPYNDKPISDPSADRFRMDPFARAIAASIQKMAAPEGTVIALNGPWGSGKSSATNLIKFHLREAVDADELAIINFACWWFRGEEALALAFFRELYSGLAPSAGEKFKEALPKIGAKLLKAGAMVGAGIDLAGGIGAGAVASGAMNWLSSLISDDGDPVEKLYAQLANALANQSKRFLIVIDDMDRLSPDEALLIFRLVKSVGRLPNVIYLLVFDRQLAEAIVSERFPSEGPHYLEKIVQAAFDLPSATPEHLNQQFLEQFEKLCGTPSEADIIRFMNVYYDVVSPLLKMPRDLNRLLNAISVTWPAIGAEVDASDFVGLEALRVLAPSIHRNLRSNKERLCGMRDATRSDADRADYDHALLGTSEGPGIDKKRRMLMRIFPPLESVWSNHLFDSDTRQMWERTRRACSPAHFDAYFRLSLGEDSLPLSEIDVLINNASKAEFVEATFREAAKVFRSNGNTKVALLLDELNIHADRIPTQSIEPLLAVLFRIADDLPSDESKAFSIGNNGLRIHWLLRRLTRSRLDLDERSAMFVAACKDASLEWLVDFADSAHRDHHAPDSKELEPDRFVLTTEADAAKLRKQALNRIRTASKSDELISSHGLPYLLFQWRALADDNGAEVKTWTAAQLDDDTKVVSLAKSFTSYGWSQSLGFAGMGDTVARRNTRASVASVDKIMDKLRFRARVEEMASRDGLEPESKAIIQAFLEAWIRYDKNPRG